VGGDDQLGLVFACCHPALALEVRVALTLRFVAGLTTRQIAAAFVLPEATLAQRLVRAKRKISESGIRFEVPGPDALAGRLDGVHAVVYLVFNEGYAASGGEQLIHADLCEEAIWLGRLLHRLLPEDTETAGLVALMLLHHSRAAARQDPDGGAVLLADQDRARWDAALIAEGTAILDAAVARRRPGPYQIEAAIAALHAAADGFEATDWPQIAALYGTLARLSPSPVVEVNRAVAVGMADGPHAGLAILEPVLASGALTGYAPLHAAHADLLERAGLAADASAAWARAERAMGNAALQRELHRRRAAAAGSELGSRRGEPTVVRHKFPDGCRNERSRAVGTVRATAPDQKGVFDGHQRPRSADGQFAADVGRLLHGRAGRAGGHHRAARDPRSARRQRGHPGMDGQRLRPHLRRRHRHRVRAR